MKIFVRELKKDEYAILKEFLYSKYIETEGSLIEKSILREAASPRSKAYSRDELIIFPYYYLDASLMHYTEHEFEFIFP
ncbi:hypothetical protein A5881_003628 [Enterococcus termitis]|nr:hypothetical protein A5881_000002 [Enterococcus termitis]